MYINTINKLKKSIKEFNKCASKANVEIVEICRNEIIVKFTGSFCRTCGVYDYFEDLIVEMEKFGIKPKIKKVEEKNEVFLVTFKIENFSQAEEITIEIKKLGKTEVGKMVSRRIKEFENIGESSEEKIFSELCFCILTANFNAERVIKIQEELEKDFLRAEERKLAKKLKELGYRYPNMRAKYIVEAREKLFEVMKILKNKKINEFEKREWLVKNIKGLGYKEASHFLRNIGYKNLAIIDFHILDLLERFKLIDKKPKNLNKKKYLEIENLLRKIADRVCITLAELDLYLWYMETGKVLK